MTAPLLGQIPGRATKSQPRVERAKYTAERLKRLGRAKEPSERQQLINDVVLANLPVARSIALRYRNRGIADADLVQVGYLGLLQAAQRFDPRRGQDFLPFAVATVRGELRKHFRDHGWSVRPPRRLQELQGRIRAAADDLTQRLGRSPRPTELAQELDVPVEDVNEALAVDGCFSPSSLDRPLSSDGDDTLGDHLAQPDAADSDAAEARVLLAPLLRDLDRRDQRILYLRFFENRTQQEIADDIGVTQMHVSRLLSCIFGKLRAALAE